MQNNHARLFITGGAGFIGCNLVKFAIKSGYSVLNYDKLTYAGNLSSLDSLKEEKRYSFVRGDIKDGMKLGETLKSFGPDAILHLAAESHVDRSIDGPSDFIDTNILGSFTLLESARKYYASLDADAASRFRFLHVSTDEVFGSLGVDGRFDEHTPYSPRSPYSASKAASDHLARAWFHTYGLPAIITNCSNNYGPYQFPEKLIPHIILSALDEKTLPVYGDGGNVRDWLFVGDHCRALIEVMEYGKPGETFTIGGDSERTNVEVVRAICAILDDISPKRGGGSYADLIKFVKDRPGHDRRYAIDASKIKSRLCWKPSLTFEEGLRETVGWYIENSGWTGSILNGVYRLSRVGLGQQE